VAEKNWATYCDGDMVLFSTEDAARALANSQISDCREAKYDGWEEELVEGICVLKVVARAKNLHPDLDYRCADYALSDIEECSQSQRTMHNEVTGTIITGILCHLPNARSLSAEIMELLKRRGYVAQILHCNQLADGTNV
jgi:hypothetical protein